MSKKAGSGIKRVGGGKMTPKDAYLLQDYERYVRSQDEKIPKYIKSEMTRDEMQEAILSHIKDTKEAVSISGTTLYPEDVDGRYPDAKDSRFSRLIGEMNAIDMSKIPEIPSDSRGNSGPEYYRLERTVEKITLGYSTRELREFVSGELGSRIYKGGRSEYITTITLDLQNKFLDRGRGNAVKRNRLDEMTSRVESFTDRMYQAVSVRNAYARKISAIRAKYKKS